MYALRCRFCLKGKVTNNKQTRVWSSCLVKRKKKQHIEEWLHSSWWIYNPVKGIKSNMIYWHTAQCISSPIYSPYKKKKKKMIEKRLIQFASQGGCQWRGALAALINALFSRLTSRGTFRTESGAQSVSLHLYRGTAALQGTMGSQVYQVSQVKQDLQDIPHTVQGWAALCTITFTFRRYTQQRKLYTERKGQTRWV